MSGEMLRNVLSKRGIVLAELAKSLGMSPQHLNQALNAADVKSGFLEKLCEVLNVEMWELYGAPAPANNSFNRDTNINDTQTMADLLAMLRAKDEQINRLLALLEKLQ